jgi:hypothetical protein
MGEWEYNISGNAPGSAYMPVLFIREIACLVFSWNRPLLLEFPDIADIALKMKNKEKFVT